MGKQSNKESKIKWTKALCPKSGQPQEYGIVSYCGCFHIGKCLVDGRPKYTLWHNTQIIGTWDTAEPAKLEAEKIKKGDHMSNRIKSLGFYDDGCIMEIIK